MPSGGALTISTSNIPLAARGRLHPDMVVLNKPYRKAHLAARIREILNDH